MRRNYWAILNLCLLIVVMQSFPSTATAAVIHRRQYPNLVEPTSQFCDGLFKDGKCWTKDCPSGWNTINDGTACTKGILGFKCPNGYRYSFMWASCRAYCPTGWEDKDVGTCIKPYRYVKEPMVSDRIKSLITSWSRYAHVTKCDVANLKQWNGGDCWNNQGMTDVTIVSDATRDMKGYVGVDHGNQIIVVAVRGSASSINDNNNQDAVLVGPTSNSLTDWPWLAALDAARVGGGYLGSGNAGRIVKVTFGSPRVGNWPFAQFARDAGHQASFRVVNGSDVVPHLPPQASFAHHSSRLLLTDASKKLIYCDDADSTASGEGNSNMCANMNNIIADIANLGMGAILQAQNTPSPHSFYFGISPQSCDARTSAFPVAARYVRVELREAQFLHFLELEVFNAAGTNIAMGKKATSKSTLGSYFASNAVDGNKQTFAHTLNDNPWWEVDLGSLQTISGIRIHNRVDCCSDRIANGVLILLNQIRGSVLETPPFRSSAPQIVFGAIPTTSKFNPFPISARYVHIENRRGGYLHFGEIQVFRADGVNVALNKKSYAGSTLPGNAYPASKAVDGNNN
ncbi:hypothetical protein HK098_006076, partial [Nowakowskiella sp. JEL0407]